MKNNFNRIAVALSIYNKDNLSYLKVAINSLLSQSYKNFDLYIEVDGECNEDMREYLDYCNFCYNNFFISFNEKNAGLAYRLNSIIDKVSKGNYDFLARMDADDICHNLRFEKQITFFLNNPDVDIVGSDVIEIDCNGFDIYYKKMDCSHEVICNKIIKKCPLNHPSVMFRMNVFFSLENRYKPELKNTQDYYFWIDLIFRGYKISNINEPLLKFRVNESFYSRRGFSKAVNDVNSRFYALKLLGGMNLSNFFHILLIFFLRLAPGFIKKIIYKRFR